MRTLWSGLLLAAAVSPARGLDVTAAVNRATVALNEQVVLSVTVSGEETGLPEPRIPSIPNFNIHSAGRSQNISWVNGRITNTVRHNFVLVPRFVGKATIPPVTVSAGGATAGTQPIEITVVRPTQAPGGPTGPSVIAPGTAGRGTVPAAPAASRENAPDLFVTAEVDKAQPYVNEQAVLTVRFHTAVPLLGNAEWIQPEARGFLTEDLPPGPHRRITRAGRLYYVSEVRLALFPVQSGPLTVGETVIRARVQEQADADPFAPDFFQKFFSQGMLAARTRELRTRPLRLRARPLPEEGRPPEYSGAVGDFRVRAELDRASASVGDAVNLTVRVEGSGNLKTLGDLALPDMGQLRVYETVSSLDLQKDERGVRGVKTYKTVLVPRASGRLTIPSIPFAYFDPDKGRYVRLRTAPAVLDVRPGKKPAGPVGFDARGAGAGITRLAADIRHIRRSLDSSWPARLAADFSRRLWLHAVPAVLFLACLGYTLYESRVQRDPARARFQQALRRARERVRESRRKADPRGSASLLAEALTGYVGDKLARPASGLTLRDAQRLLRERFPKLPDGHLDRMRMVWEDLETHRFAPAGAGGSDGRELAEGVLELLEALEEGLSR